MSSNWRTPIISFEELIPASRWIDSKKGLFEANFTQLAPSAQSPASLPIQDFPSCLSREEREMPEWTSRAVHSLGYYKMSSIIMQGAGYLWRDRQLCAGDEFQQEFVRRLLLDRPKLVGPRRSYRLRKLSSPALLFVCWDFNNYGHWCMDMLPRLYALHEYQPEFLEQLKIVLPKNLSVRFLHMLKTLFSLRKESFYTYDPDKEVVQCEQAIVPNMVHRNYHYHPIIRNFYQNVAERYKERLRPIGSTGLLYVSRRDFVSTVNRRARILSNTDQLEDLVLEYGFEMIEPEKYSWEEQVAIFANAKAVVGEHGSALKGLLFSPQGTRLVAFNFLNKTQAVIAALKGQQYVAVKSSGFDERRWRKKRYSVDLEKVEQCLKWALR